MKIEKIGNNKDMKIIVDEVEGTVTFPDVVVKDLHTKGDRPEKWTIAVDKSGNKFFYIVNPYGTKLGFEGLTSILFTDFPGLAVQSVMDGYADAIEAGGFFGYNNLCPIRFLDRNVGNFMRFKTMEGFTDAKFAWTVYFRNSKSFDSVWAYIDLNKNARQLLDDSEILSFDNIDDAWKFKDSLTDDDFRKMIEMVTGKDYPLGFFESLMQGVKLSIKQILVK